MITNVETNFNWCLQGRIEFVGEVRLGRLTLGTGKSVSVWDARHSTKQIIGSGLSPRLKQSLGDVCAPGQYIAQISPQFFELLERWCSQSRLVLHTTF